MARPVLVLSTCGQMETAQKIASALVEQRLAACVNVVGGVKSTYRWQGKVTIDDETLLIIKTSSDKLQNAQNLVKEQSVYEVPEFIAIDIVDGSEEYLKWLLAEVE